MAESKNLAEDPYERLADAIVLQAVSDYRTALKKIMDHPKNRGRSAKPWRLRSSSVLVGTAY